MNEEEADKLHVVETCASEVLALRLALSLIEMGAEPVGVIAAVRRRDEVCAKARSALRGKSILSMLDVSQVTGLAPGKIRKATWENGPLTPGEARAILAAFEQAALEIAEDAFDAGIAAERLKEIGNTPGAVLDGQELEDKLKLWLA